MMLHDAITKVLVDAGRPMTTSQIADRINADRLYEKRDGTPVSAFQVHGRTRNYPKLFARDGALVRVAGREHTTNSETAGPAAAATATLSASTVSSIPADAGLVSQVEAAPLELDLLAPDSFRLAGRVDRDVPDRPGLYAIRLRDRNALPEPFRTLSEMRGHDLIYLGIASQSLSRRFLGQELRARGHGTFFRSIGAVLGFRPLAGSLTGKANTRNFTFTPADNRAIIEWIDANLLVNWVEFSGGHAVEESALIRKHLPLLNLQGNPAALPELSALRAECVRIANLNAV